MAGTDKFNPPGESLVKRDLSGLKHTLGVFPSPLEAPSNSYTRNKPRNPISVPSPSSIASLPTFCMIIAFHCHHHLDVADILTRRSQELFAISSCAAHPFTIPRFRHQGHSRRSEGIGLDVILTLWLSQPSHFPSMSTLPDRKSVV